SSSVSISPVAMWSAHARPYVAANASASPAAVVAPSLSSSARPPVRPCVGGAVSSVRRFAGVTMMIDSARVVRLGGGVARRAQRVPGIGSGLRVGRAVHAQRKRRGTDAETAAAPAPSLLMRGVMKIHRLLLFLLLLVFLKKFPITGASEMHGIVLSFELPVSD